MKEEQSHSDSTRETGAAPSLWNPIALANWSLLLTPVWGAYLVAANYKTMGKSKEKEEAMVWFYVGIVFFLLSAFLLAPSGVSGLGGAFLIYLIYLVSWNFMSARKQQRAVLAEYGDIYKRQPWAKVLTIGIAAIIMWQIIVSAFSSNVTSHAFPKASFDSVEVKQVKNGVIQLCPSHTVEQMVNGFLGSPSWNSGKSADGKVFVNVEGDITFKDKPVRAMVQFIVEGESFSFNAFEMNGVPSANLIALGLLNKMCASAEGSVAKNMAESAPETKNSDVTKTTTTQQLAHASPSPTDISALTIKAISLRPMDGSSAPGVIVPPNVMGYCGTSLVAVMGIRDINSSYFQIDTDTKIIISAGSVKERQLIIDSDSGVLSDYNGVACVTTGSGDRLLVWSVCGGNLCGGLSYFVIDPERQVFLAPLDPLKEQCDEKCASQLLGNQLSQQINGR